MRYNHKEIIDWSVEILIHYGVSGSDAEIVSKMLLAADLRNIFSHGIAGGTGLEDIIKKINCGGINPTAQCIFPEQVSKPAILNINANGGLGHVASFRGVILAKQIARKYGLAKVYIYNSSHFGSAGIYSELICEEKDLAGRVTCNSPAWTVLYNSQNNYKNIKKRLGTNPIAWSTPYKDGIVTIDMSTTQKAASMALQAAKENMELKNHISNNERATASLKMIPSNYLQDYAGRQITCPVNTKIVEECSVRPLGGESFGYKGSGLGVSIELDCIIGGSQIGLISTGDKTSDGRVTQIIEAWSVESLLTKEEAIQRLTDNVCDIKEYGGELFKLPGQIESEYLEDYSHNGIPFSPNQVMKLKKIGEYANVPFSIASI